MMVAGLWVLLKQRGLVRSVCGAEARQLLEGKRIAIDVSYWAVQGTTAENTATTRCQHFLPTSFWRLTRLLRIGCFLVAVIEKITQKRSEEDVTETVNSNKAPSSSANSFQLWVAHTSRQLGKRRSAALN